jgi:RNA polymerase sigma-70 factor, ECF subfamily
MAPDPDESTLVARAVTRDEEAFAELYFRHHDTVRRRIRRIIGDAQEADDVTSEVFVRAWNAIDRYEDRGLPILAWLCTIAQRLSVNHLRERRRNLTLDEIPQEMHRGDTPEEIAERNWVASGLQQAMVELPDTQREVLSKRFLEQLTFAEIGSSLGKRPATVRVIQHRALRSLRLIILRNGYLGSASTAHADVTHRDAHPAMQTTTGTPRL